MEPTGLMAWEGGWYRFFQGNIQANWRDQEARTRFMAPVIMPSMVSSLNATDTS
jgi:hypothetical protein